MTEKEERDKELKEKEEEESKEIKEVGEKKEEKLSKKQQRKLAKKEEKQKMWEETRGQIRKARKERAKERRQELREKGEYKPPKKKRNIENIQIGGRIIIDCDFDDKMNEREVKSLFNQIQLLYGANWKYEKPLMIRCVGVSGKLKELVKKRDADKWKLITFEETKLEELKDVQKIYLTAESKNELDTLDPNTFYIIGGIVDHNKYKNLCENKAVENSIQTLSLPITKYIDCLGRRVLTVNQVFEILGEQTQCNDWKSTFEKILPKRKQTAKNDDSDDVDELSI